MSVVSFHLDIEKILQSKLYKFVVCYLFILTVIASRQKEPSIYKNILFRLAVNILVFHTFLEISILETFAYAMATTILSFVFTEA